jgi:hypothetical protein
VWHVQITKCLNQLFAPDVSKLIAARVDAVLADSGGCWSLDCAMEVRPVSFIAASRYAALCAAWQSSTVGWGRRGSAARRAFTPRAAMVQVFLSLWYVEHLATVQVISGLFLRGDVSEDNALDLAGNGTSAVLRVCFTPVRPLLFCLSDVSGCLVVWLLFRRRVLTHRALPGPQLLRSHPTQVHSHLAVVFLPSETV